MCISSLQSSSETCSEDYTPPVKGRRLTLKWRMQSHAQEQPLALAAVKSLYPTNGKEEEVNTGEVAPSLISPYSNTVARAVQLLSSWMTEDESVSACKEFIPLLKKKPFIPDWGPVEGFFPNSIVSNAAPNTGHRACMSYHITHRQDLFLSPKMWRHYRKQSLQQLPSVSSYQTNQVQTQASPDTRWKHKPDTQYLRCVSHPQAKRTIPAPRRNISGIT